MRSALPSSARPRFGSVFLIAVEMGCFALDPQSHTSIDQTIVESRRLQVLSRFASGPSRLSRGFKPAPGGAKLWQGRWQPWMMMSHHVGTVEDRDRASVISDAVTQEVTSVSGIDETQIVA